MTLLKNVLLSLAIAPLAMSMSSAGGPVEIQEEPEPMIVGISGKAYFPDFSIKQKLIPPPAILEERRVISKQRVDILKAQALAIAIAATENPSDNPTVQENKKLRDD